jgi:hypothetical protein
MANSPPDIRLTGIRASVPQGYMLGRVSAGIGGVELISMARAQAAGLIPTQLPGPPTGAAGGDLSGTYPNPVVAQLQGRPVASTLPSNLAVLLYHTSGATWLPVVLGAAAYSNSYLDLSNLPPLTGGTTGQVLTKNSNTDYDVSWVTPSAGGGSAASSFWLDGTHGYVAEVDSSGLIVTDSSGNAVYDTDPVLPPAMLPVATAAAFGAMKPDGTTITVAAGVASAVAALPNALCFQAKLTADQSVTTGSSNLVKPDTFIINTLGTQYSVSTGKFTPTKAGKYIVFCTCQGKSTSPDTITQAQGTVFKNGGAGVGTQICNGQSGPAPAAPTFSFASLSFGIADMNGSTDTLEMSGRVDVTGAAAVVILGAGNVTFGAIYIGP